MNLVIVNKFFWGKLRSHSFSIFSHFFHGKVEKEEGKSGTGSTRMISVGFPGHSFFNKNAALVGFVFNTIMHNYAFCIVITTNYAKQIIVCHMLL